MSIDAVQSFPNVDEWRTRTWLVTLNAGKESGVTAGIKVHLQTSSLERLNLEIVGVKKKTSQGVIRQEKGQDPTPTKGWRFSTKDR